jgi:hypothetical protein
MPHPREMKFEETTRAVSRTCRQGAEFLRNAAAQAEELEDAYTYAGGSNQALADMLVRGTATAEQVAVVADARAAMQVFADVWSMANGGAVAQEDRVALVRRMA